MLARDDDDEDDEVDRESDESLLVDDIELSELLSLDFLAVDFSGERDLCFLLRTGDEDERSEDGVRDLDRFLALKYNLTNFI